MKGICPASVALVAALITTASVFATEAPPAIAPADENERTYLLRDFLFVTSPEIEAYLQSVATKLLQTRNKPPATPKFILYSSSGFNAMVDSARNVVISTEVLQQIESEDELAALLGHELTHVLFGHPEKKSLLGKFPLSIETMGEIIATGDQIKSDQEKNIKNPTAAAATANTAAPPTHLAKQSMRTSQNVSLFWSDLLMPNWNKEDEREADTTGYDMMRAAGYDPDAFATLFQRLHAAQLARSARMEQLRLSMIRKAQARELPPATGGAYATALREAGEEVRKTASEKAVNALFDEVAKMGKNYDSPEKRQDLLDQHAAKLPPLDGNVKPRSPAFAATLRDGAGGTLLKFDLASLKATAAIEAGDMKAAGEAIAPLLPPTGANAPPPGSGKKASAKSASGPNKKPAEAKAAQTAGKSPSAPSVAVGKPIEFASAHLNAAVGKWMLEQGKDEIAELYAKQWSAYSRAPAKAFLWRAAHQAERGEFAAASSTLDDGGRRLGSVVPFLPRQVTYALQLPDLARAQNLTRDCRAEEEKRKSLFMRMLDVFRDSPPAGLYAECLANLGAPLPDDGSKFRKLLATPFKKSTNTVEGLAK